MTPRVIAGDVFPARRADGRANPLSADFDAAYAFSDAALPPWTPTCGKTGEAIVPACVGCNCWDRR
jgi:hypothetical protein